MSKMGISLLSSYQGAQIFEAIGIGEDLLQLGFRGTPSRLGGLEVHDLACETASFMASVLAGGWAGRGGLGGGGRGVGGRGWVGE